MPFLHQISCRKRPRSSDMAVPCATEITNVRVNSALVSSENDEPISSNFSTFKKKKSLRQARQGKGSRQSLFFSRSKDKSDDNIKAVKAGIVEAGVVEAGFAEAGVAEAEVAEAGVVEAEVAEEEVTEDETKEHIKLTIPTIIISLCDKFACKMSTSAIELISGIKTVRSTSSQNTTPDLSEVDEGMED